MKDRIYLSSPHMSKEGYEQKYIKEAFDTNWIAPLGENVNKFEEELAKYVGIKHAAALSSGTAAIHMAFKALDVKQGEYASKIIENELFEEENMLLTYPNIQIAGTKYNNTSVAGLYKMEKTYYIQVFSENTN